MRSHLESFFNYLQYERRLSQHTVTAYRSDLYVCADFLKDTFDTGDVASVEYTMVRAWVVDMMENGFKERSINRKISALSSFYSYLQAEGIIAEGNDPTQKVKKIKIPRNLPVFAKQQEMTQLFSDNLFTDDFYGYRDKVVLMMLYGTGMRRAELCGLQVGQLSLSSKTVKVLGKRSKERVVPLPDHLVEQVKVYLPLRPSQNEWLIQTNDGQAPYPQLIYRIVKKYLSVFTDAEKTSPHILRHSYATHLLNNGADLNAIKELLGHASLSATEVYTHNSLERIKEIYDKTHPKS